MDPDIIRSTIIGFLALDLMRTIPIVPARQALELATEVVGDHDTEQITAELIIVLQMLLMEKATQLD